MKTQSVERIQFSNSIEISVIVPHFYPGRRKNLEGLISDLRNQSFQALEVLIVHQVSPQGRAINLGVSQAQGEFLLVMDDDSRMGHSQVIENLREVLRRDPAIAMAGASIISPEEANLFQKMAAKQFPRFQMPVVRELIDSDLPCHGCVLFQKKAFVEVGMERDDILRGLDPDLRVRFRKAGYRVVLVPDTWACHPLPATFGKFIQTFFRNGYGSAYLQKVHPELCYDTDESIQNDQFVPKRSFLYRVVRYPFRLAKALITFQWIRLLGYAVYVAGYAAGFLHFFFSPPAAASKTRSC